MVTEKRISGIKRTFFIDNVKNIFVLSILRDESGQCEKNWNFARAKREGFLLNKEQMAYS